MRDNRYDVDSMAIATADYSRRPTLLADRPHYSAEYVPTSYPSYDANYPAYDAEDDADLLEPMPLAELLTKLNKVTTSLIRARKELELIELEMHEFDVVAQSLVGERHSAPGALPLTRPVRQNNDMVEVEGPVRRQRIASGATLLGEVERPVRRQRVSFAAPVEEPEFTDEEELDETPAPPSPIKRIVSIVCNVLMCIFCVSALGAAALSFGDDSAHTFFGYRFYTVATGSMTPGPDSPPGGFHAGALIIVKEANTDTIRIGDIITFSPGANSGVFLTHRVVDIKSELSGTPGLWFVTRGDANNADDPPVAADLVFGKKVFGIEKLGSVLQQTRANPIPSAIFVLATLGFVVAIRACFGKSERNTQVQTMGNASRRRSSTGGGGPAQR
ncbi:MAG: signal peptidase I [Propionibacteriaceae bacterium]|jgi:signal peptidase I|nr:signal peptidase I [Propionibacteriaceae bacterium]